MTKKIRLANLKDARGIWEIRNHPLSKLNSLNQEEIPLEKHLTWFKEKYLENGNNYCFVLDLAGKIAGYCRFDLSENSHYRVSIAIDPDHKSRGLGHILLNQALIQAGPGKFYSAEIKKGNIVSVKLFVKNRFVRVSEDNENYYYEKK